MGTPIKHDNLVHHQIRGNLKTNNRQAKKGRSKARTRKMKRMTAKIDDILTSISPLYKSSGTVGNVDLRKVLRARQPLPGRVNQMHCLE